MINYFIYKFILSHFSFSTLLPYSYINIYTWKIFFWHLTYNLILLELDAFPKEKTCSLDEKYFKVFFFLFYLGVAMIWGRALWGQKNLMPLLQMLVFNMTEEKSGYKCFVTFVSELMILVTSFILNFNCNFI